MKDDCGVELAQCAARDCRRTTDAHDPDDPTPWYCRDHVYLARDEAPEGPPDDYDRAVAAYERGIFEPWGDR